MGRGAASVQAGAGPPVKEPKRRTSCSSPAWPPMEDRPLQGTHATKVCRACTGRGEVALEASERAEARARPLDATASKRAQAHLWQRRGRQVEHVCHDGRVGEVLAQHRPRRGVALHQEHDGVLVRGLHGVGDGRDAGKQLRHQPLARQPVPRRRGRRRGGRRARPLRSCSGEGVHNAISVIRWVGFHPRATRRARGTRFAGTCDGAGVRGGGIGAAAGDPTSHYYLHDERCAILQSATKNRAPPGLG